jgi:hypothetical protein
MKRFFGLVGFVVAAISAAHAADKAAPPPACSSAEYRQFDFWAGDWNVTQNGKQAGTNRIDKILGGCALLENWAGTGGSFGHSLNYYDASRKVWHQTWVDNQGGPLELEGKLEHGNMVLAGNTLDPATGAATLNRITWTPQADAKVRQHWETSADGGKTWQTAFDGLYARK